jgi:hypothetical protein
MRAVAVLLVVCAWSCSNDSNGVSGSRHVDGGVASGGGRAADGDGRPGEVDAATPMPDRGPLASGGSGSVVCEDPVEPPLPSPGAEPPPLILEPEAPLSEPVDPGPAPVVPPPAPIPTPAESPRPDAGGVGGTGPRDAGPAPECTTANPPDPERTLREISLEEADAVAEEVALAYCEQVLGCCPLEDDFQRRSCLSLLSGSLDFDTDHPTVLIDDAAKERCIEGAASMTCERGLMMGDCGRFPFLMGTADVGEACEWNQDCMAGAGGEADCVDGVCYQRPRGRLGDACSKSCELTRGKRSCYAPPGASTDFRAAFCYHNDGLYCADCAGCQPLLGLGEPCTGFHSCEGNLLCNNGVCSEPSPLGSSCSLNDCSREHFCRDVCTAPLETGESCESNEDCRTGECSDVCEDVTSVCEGIRQAAQ